MKTTKLLLNLAALLGVVFTAELHAQTSAFTYQGRLTDNGSPANGFFDITFSVWTNSSGPAQVGDTITNLAVPVSNDVFTSTVDFGPATFTGLDLWLELGVSTNGAGTFSTLSPRQRVTSAPYAITAGNLSGPVPSGGLSGTYSEPITLNNAANSFTGDGAGLLNVNATTLNGLTSSNFWQLGGNAGTTSGTHFLGTTDDQPLEIKVNHLRALLLYDAGDGSSDPDSTPDGAPNVVGGSPANMVGVGVVGATISGGGATDWFSLVLSNAAWADYGVIGGGVGHTVQADAPFATIGGGRSNYVTNNAYGGVIGGGVNNRVGQNGTVAGGANNKALGIGSFVGGGGSANQSGGALGNSALGDYSAISGGLQNSAAGFLAIVPGGFRNDASGDYALAAGNGAKANHTGSFVWSDSTGTDFTSLRDNQFRARAQGGVRFDVNHSEWVEIHYQSSLIPHTVIATSTGAYLSSGGSWVNSSDAARKENFEPVDVGQVLDAVCGLSLRTWNYRAEPEAIRHVGPTAQDFQAAFGLGADEKHIATVDADGVALAAIQGLNQKLEQKETEIAELRRTVNGLKELVNAMNHQLNGGAK